MKDPVDHARTTRSHAGEALKDGKNVPGLVALAAAVLILAVSLYLLADDQPATGGPALLIAAALAGGGWWWLAMRHREVRRHEREYLEQHPDVPPTPPTS